MFMNSLTSVSAKFVWMSLDRPTCSTIHLLQIDRMLILSWDMGNIQQNKKKTLFKTENAYKLILFFETEACGNSQMATKKICFPIN